MHTARLLFVIMVLPACSSTNRLLKARPAQLSPFFEQPRLAVDASKQLPFQKIWTTPDRTVLAAGVARRKIYVAPVTLAYLRPVKKAVARQEISWGVQRLEQDVARRLRDEFVQAFRHSPRPLYQVVSQPGPDTLTLHLAITELNPTSPKGNAVMTMLKFTITPVAGLARFFTSGNMAIEGKIIEGTSKRTFFQFADNEADKITFLSVRDYQPYGHAVHTMRAWAMQFEEMTRSPGGQKIRDSSSITLLPY